MRTTLEAGDRAERGSNRHHGGSEKRAAERCGTGRQPVRAYVDTETARIFFGDSAQDTFGTVLHEDYHWYNALDSEGAKTLQDHALLYLARSSGFETVDEMIREKMTDYAQQNLTYEEAAEELVGDAWRGIFSNESDFKRWVEFQRGQAEKNSGRAGTIRTVMNRVKEMLGGIVSRAKEVLTLDPDNRAALKAQRLAENERRIYRTNTLPTLKKRWTTCAVQKKMPLPSRQRARRKDAVCGSSCRRGRKPLKNS